MEIVSWILDMLSEVFSAVDKPFEYWIKKNHAYGRYPEIFDQRVWDWCLRVWGRFCGDRRYQLGFVLFRIESGSGFPPHRDKGSGKEVILIVFSGSLSLNIEGELHQLNAGDYFGFHGNRIHSVEAGGSAKYLVLFSKKLR